MFERLLVDFFIGAGIVFVAMLVWKWLSSKFKEIQKEIKKEKD